MRRNPEPRGGFTFLELLLVLLLLGLAAAVAFPRLTGVYGAMRAERERSALVRLVEHGERQARLRGVPLTLAWDARERVFELRPFDAERDGLALAVEEPELGRRVAAAPFLDWLENDSDLLREFGAGEPAAAADQGEAPERIAELFLDPETDVDVRGLPLRFDPDGESSGGSITLSYAGGGRSELELTPLGGRPAWSEEGR